MKHLNLSSANCPSKHLNLSTLKTRGTVPSAISFPLARSAYSANEGRQAQRERQAQRAHQAPMAPATMGRSAGLLGRLPRPRPLRQRPLPLSQRPCPPPGTRTSPGRPTPRRARPPANSSWNLGSALK